MMTSRSDLLLTLTLMTFAVTFHAGQGQLDSRTVLQYLQDEKLSTLVGFITATGLDAVLGDPKSSAVTVFAPSEAAFDKLPDDVLFTLATNSTILKSVLQGHVVDQVVLSLYLRDGDVKTNLNGDPMVFRVYDNGNKTINGARLTGRDISLSNGVVHLIDDVIMPTDTNIGEYIANHDTDFKDLFGLLVLGRLFGELETNGPYTVFAPKDGAFEAITPILTILISDRPKLTDVLKNHVVSNTYWSVGLRDGMTLTTINGKNLTITIDNEGVKVNDAKVTMADIHTSNGVIHVIDKVIT